MKNFKFFHRRIFNALIGFGLAVGVCLPASGESSGNFALLLATNLGSITDVEELIAAGADVNWADKEGRTAMMAAISEGNSEIVNVLIAAGRM